jgi:hypothetical protein
MGLTARAVVSRLREVTHLPLFKIFAYIDFGRGEFVFPPTCMNEKIEGERERGLSDEFESNVCLAPMFGAHHV